MIKKFQILPPSLFESNGKAMTDSYTVAKFFNKRHDNVIRDIRNLLRQVPELRGLNFEESFEIKHLGNTDKRTPFFRMDRKGFMLLAMGFSGPKAVKLKIAYIDAFDAMERHIAKNHLSNMQEVINLIANFENNKARASLAGKALSEWSHIKQPLQARLQIALDTVQLSLPLQICLDKAA